MWDFIDDLDLEVLGNSERPALIIKHSIRCSISAMALDRLMRSHEPIDRCCDVYLIDVIRNRSLSNKIEQQYRIRHESPQVIMVKEGIPTYTSSHMAIDPETILDHT